jgi:serine/threonine-protein kinase
LREFERLREALPHEADALFNLAVLLRAVGRWEEATQTFVEALRLDPVNPGLAFEVGAIHRMMRRYNEAKSYLELAVSLDPSVAQPWHYLTGVYLWEGDTQGARLVLDSAASHLDPEELRAQRVNVELFERRPETALEILLAATDQGGGFYAMAVTEVAYIAGRYDLSRSYADTLMQAAEARLEARGETDAVTEMFFARANAFSGNYDQAIRHAEQSIELARHALLRSQIQRDVAETYVIAGRYEKAVTLIGQLLSRPGDALSVDLLRLNPIWDPLRERPDFQALLERYGN